MCLFVFNGEMFFRIWHGKCLVKKIENVVKGLTNFIGGLEMKTTLYEIMDALTAFSQDDDAIIKFVNYLIDTGQVQLTD